MIRSLLEIVRVLVPEQVKSLPDVGYMRMLNPEGILSVKPTLIIATGELARPSFALRRIEKQVYLLKLLRVSTRSFRSH